MVDYKVILTGIIPQVTEVRLYNETIDKVVSDHSEVVSVLNGTEMMVSSIEGGLVTPTHIEKSYNNSFVFIDSNTMNESGDPLRIPVKVVSGTSARVKSFYFASTNGSPNVVWKACQ